MIFGAIFSQTACLRETVPLRNGDFLLVIIDARRMRESYCNHPVCLSVAALALTYDVCATKLAYQCNLCCTQKALN